MTKIAINLAPITKKNSQRIIQVHGRPMIMPSAKYKQYEKNCAIYLQGYECIDQPVNVKCLYYMPTRRRVDLSNLINSTLDILVHYGIILDDNRNIVYSVDGSRVLYDKNYPRTEIEITEIEDAEIWAKK